MDLYTLNYFSVPEDAINDQTRAIMIINLLCNPYDFEKLKTP